MSFPAATDDAGFPAAAIRALPSIALVGCAVATAWLDRGSIAAAEWLRYALLAGLLLATVVVVGSVRRLSLLPLTAVVATCGLALWTGLSAAWSPIPSLARDEALLITLYAVCLGTPALTLLGSRERRLALAGVPLGLALLAVLTAVVLRLDADPSDAYLVGRLSFPIAYANAQAAVLVVGFWPAIALAAQRDGHPVLRALSLGAASTFLAGWLLTQSKGAGIALAVSALVVFAIAPRRVRVLAPTLLAATPAALAFAPLTEPFHMQDDPGFVGAIHAALDAFLVVAAAGAVLGLAYAAADRRIRITSTVARAAGAAALLAAATALATSVAVFFIRVDDASAYASDKWEAFKTTPRTATGRTHFSNLGSNRYDFWRVSLHEFAQHPVAGVGARGFGTIYLGEGKSPETPARAHSLPLEVLMETGVVGLLLLVAAVAPGLVHAARRAASPSGLALLGGGTYWLVHASGDWIWTFPAAGIVFFVLLGIGVSDEDGAEPLGRRTAVPTGIAAALVAVVLYVPPWLSARLSADALAAGDPSSLELAQTLDPLSMEPLLVRATLAPTDEGKLAALREAVERQPRSPTLHHLLGTALLEAGRREAARGELRRALELSPRDRMIAEALDRAGG